MHAAKARLAARRLHNWGGVYQREVSFSATELDRFAAPILDPARAAPETAHP